MKNYDHKKIELKWQKEWDKKKIYHALDKSKKPKFYSLIEFPYPSGEGLHVGHPRPYTGMDIVSRKRRMEGYNVLFPLGWDAFGLPTENYAIKTGKQPKVIVKKNTDNFRRQIKSLGISFDWSREINTTDPTYYKWTQWLFLQFLKKGLAYKTKSEINWCPSCKIGLANEEVIDGKCERCGTPTEKKEKEQWMLAITKYAERLDKDLDLVDYPERVKLSQKNWIGKSEGSEIIFPIKTNYIYLILHTFKSGSKDTFYPWLKKQIEDQGSKIFVPDLPNSENPIIEDQVDFLLNNYSFTEKTIIVTHSLGGVLAMKLLSKLKTKIEGLVMVAPPLSGNVFLDNKPREALKYCCDWKFNFDVIKSKIKWCKVLIDKNDPILPSSQSLEIARKLEAQKIIIEASKGHFNGLKEPSILQAAVSSIKVFTTRADTLFGVTYVVLAPEHPLVESLKLKVENKKEVEEYLKKVKNKSDLERTENKEKTGVELKGVKAINPANNEEIPVWVADYVLPHYGTGAVMAVPAHDERDFEFAKKYNLKIKRVIEPKFICKIGPSAVHVGKEFVPRNAICAIVRNPKDGKYLCLSWKEHYMHGLVTGGIEEGEDLVEAAKREVHEETGYKNVKLVKNPDFALHSLFYHRVKSQNRWARFQYLFLELVNEERDKVSEEELKVHEAIWVSKEELKNFFTVIEGEFIINFINNPDYIFTDDGVLHNSNNFDNLDSDEARKEITKFVGGKMVTKFKLRDWVFSRQRYWGEPIPVVNCEKCGLVPVKEKDLPVKLPEVKSYKPTDTGESPLANISKWVNTKCPKCGGKAKRETDTMPNWAGSSWYYLRYIDPKNKNKFADLKKMKYWTPVDWYHGGMEHVTLHLLYSRFWHKFLYDLKLVPTKEPYKKRTSHGMILGEGGVKMSKSLGNIINPDDIVKTYGADTLRVYEMFMGPFEDAAIWNTESIIGSRRFIEKVWRIGQKISENLNNFASPRVVHSKVLEESGLNQTMQNHSSYPLLDKLLHKTIKKVSEDIEAMRFNTAISSMMIFANEVEKNNFQLSTFNFQLFLKILAPFAPHITEEIWRELGEKKTIHNSEWPKWDEEKIKDDEVKIVIQVNGKVRAEMMIKIEEKEEIIKKKALSDEVVLKFISGKEVKKIIYVRNKLVNIVV